MRPEAIDRLNKCLDLLQHHPSLNRERYTALYSDLLSTYIQSFNPLWITQYPNDPGADAGLIEKVLAQYAYGKPPITRINRLDRSHYKKRLMPGDRPEN